MNLPLLFKLPAMDPIVRMDCIILCKSGGYGRRAWRVFRNRMEMEASQWLTGKSELTDSDSARGLMRFGDCIDSQRLQSLATKLVSSGRAAKEPGVSFRLAG